MAARNIYKVKFFEGRWQIIKDGIILGYYNTRNGAIRKAIEWAKSQISSQVVIFRAHGSIEETVFNF
jgi:hypothetical protein